MLDGCYKITSLKIILNMSLRQPQIWETILFEVRTISRGLLHKKIRQMYHTKIKPLSKCSQCVNRLKVLMVCEIVLLRVRLGRNSIIIIYNIDSFIVHIKLIYSYIVSSVRWLLIVGTRGRDGRKIK